MGNTPVHVNIASDPLVGKSFHLALPSVPAGLYPALEVLVEQRWWPGASKHKITATVFHRTQGIVQQGHDCGAGILDEAPPAIGTASGYLPIIAINSSRKTVFGASTVVAEGTPIGCAERPRFPILSCGNPVPMAGTYPTKNKENTVLVGMTAQDIARGWEDIRDAQAVDLVMFGLSIFGAGSDVVEGVLGLFGIDPIKAVVGGGAGLARSIERSIASGGREPISIKLETGSGTGSGATEVKWTPATGEIEISGESGGGPGKLAGGIKRGADGKIRGTGDVPPDLFGD